MSKYRKLTTVCAAVVLAFGLAACGSGSDDDTAMPTTPGPTPTPHTCDAGASQACVDARQTELNAISNDGTVAELTAAQKALADAQAALATANAAAARQALVDAAMCNAGTADCVAAHQALVDALMADASTTVQELTAAQAGLATAKMAKAVADADAAAAAARQTLVDAAAMCTAGTQACVDAHQALVDALEADDSTSADDLAAAQTGLAGVQMALGKANAAAARQELVDGATCTDATQACVDAHQALVDALEADDTTLAADLDDARDDLETVQMAKAKADAERTAGEARQMLVEAAMCTDGTQACVDAHQALVDALDEDETTTADDLAEAQANLKTVEMAKADADAAAADTKTVNVAITAATRAIAALTAESDDDTVAAARALVAAAQTALDDAENLDDKTSLQASIDGIDTANLEAQETRIAKAEEAANTKRRADAAVAATKAAGTKRKAIAAEAAQPTDASLGGTARTDADGTTTSTDASDDVYDLAISRKRDEAATIKVTDPANAGDDDPKFEVAAMLSGGRQMLTRTMEANDDGEVMTEVVLVATDIAGPKATAFANVDGQELNVSSATGTAAVDPEVNNALDIDADEDVTGDPNPNLMFARSTTSGRLDYTRDNPVTGVPATVGVDEGLHDGTYNGAEGTYRCVATAGVCTVTFNAKGEVIANSDNWVFVPDKGATSDVPDTDYLHYGFWLKRTADADDVTTYNEVETFAGSSVDSTGAIATGVAGSASYHGDAVGVYVHSVSNPDGTEASATSGHFKADAFLTATFGQVNNLADTPVGTIASSMLNTVTGTIDEFVLSGGEGNVWSVVLSGAIDATTGTFSGTAKGGVGDGSLSGTFHGTATAATATATIEANDSVYPHSAVGEFNAGFTNGSVAGAFGVRERKD